MKSREYSTGRGGASRFLCVLMVVMLVGVALFISSCSSGSTGGDEPLPGDPFVGLQVSPVGQTLRHGETQQYLATGTRKSGKMEDLTQSVTWSSSQVSVASISDAAGSKGLATGVSDGTTMITGYYKDSVSELTSTVNLIVHDALTQGVIGVVTDHQTGNPIAGATVKIDGMDLSDVTHELGDYSFNNIDPGTYHYTVTKEGYFTQKGSFVVQAGITTVHDIKLGWESSSFDKSDASVLGTFSLAVSPDGNPSVAYPVSLGTDFYGVKIATYQHGIWTSEITVTSSTPYNQPSLVIDSSGVKHVLVLEAPGFLTGKFMYGTDSGSGWQWEPIPLLNANQIGMRCALTVDKLGRPHAAYIETANQKVVYTMKSGGSWSTPVAVNQDTVSIAEFVSIATDSQNRPLIGYVDNDSESAKNAMLAKSMSPGVWSWLQANIFSAKTASPSLVVDSSDTPFLSYVNRDTNYLQVTEFIGEWGKSTTFVDTVEIPTSPNYMALGPDNKLTVIYRKDDKLMYAVMNGNDWSNFEITSSPGLPYGYAGGLVFDLTGRVYLNYVDPHFADQLLVMWSPPKN